jgi:hypothetical protein
MSTLYLKLLHIQISSIKKAFFFKHRYVSLEKGVDLSDESTIIL